MREAIARTATGGQVTVDTTGVEAENGGARHLPVWIVTGEKKQGRKEQRSLRPFAYAQHDVYLGGESPPESRP